MIKREAVRTQLENFASITEKPGQRATGEQLEILFTRYHFAAQHAREKDVLEAACGAGVGLGYLARFAKSVTGGDIDSSNCEIAAGTYRGRTGITIRRLDVLYMPFPDASFDVVILFEALYYLSDVDRFLVEVRRVLRPAGLLIVSSVNCEWRGFNASPFSTQYFTPPEWVEILERHQFQAEVFAGFADQSSGVFGEVISIIRRTAVMLHLVPRTMKGKEWLKRIFYGRLRAIPTELSEHAFSPAGVQRLERLDDSSSYRFYYTLARVKGR